MEHALSRESVLERLRMHKGEILKEFPVRRLTFFGSLARQENVPERDVDILVDVDPSIGLKFMTLADRLQEILHCKVDLVSHRGIRPSLLQLIEKESIDV
jgi:uncharacterized protein